MQTAFGNKYRRWFYLLAINPCNFDSMGRIDDSLKTSLHKDPGEFHGKSE